jgi:LacI family transcriptional regulator
MRRSSRGVTLSDIARETGVSKVTVSCILNDRSSSSTVRVSDSTRERVLAAARTMGYHPNALARGLARRRTDTVTLVMQSPNVFSGGSGFISEMMHGVVDAANAAGLDLMLHTRALPDADAEVRSLTDGRSDGALLLRDRDDPLIAALAERGHPSVLIFSRAESAPDAWYVDVDNVRGGRLATEHLIGLGHWRIAFLGGSPHSAAVADREAGYRAALADAGLPAPPPEWVLRMNYAGDGDGLATLVRLFRDTLPPARPTALFAWSDDVALRALDALRADCGLRVPEDVSVVGFDGTAADGGRGAAGPRLTTVRQPVQEIARCGVALLVACVNGEPVDNPQRLFDPSLVPRESSAPPATR